MPNKMGALLSAFSVDTLDDLLDSLILLMQQCGLRTNFKGMDMTEVVITRMLEFIEWERLLKSPTVFDYQSVKEIFMQLL